MKKVILGALIASSLVVLTACGAGGEAVPATAQPLQVSGVVEGNPPADATVINAVGGANSDVVLAQGALDPGANPRIDFSLVDPDSVQNADLTLLTSSFSGCSGITAAPADAAYATLLEFPVFEAGSSFLPEGYVALTDASNVNSSEAGETLYAYWLVNREASVRGSCEGVSLNVDLAEGWNMVAIRKGSEGTYSIRHVATPPSGARWVWSASSFGSF
jgi:hypothetical protein